MTVAETLLDDLRGAGLAARWTPSGLAIQPSAGLTDALRERVRRHRQDLLALLAHTSAEEAEIRRHLIRVLPGEGHKDFPEALALALRDPVSSLACLEQTCAPLPGVRNG